MHNIGECWAIKLMITCCINLCMKESLSKINISPPPLQHQIQAAMNTSTGPNVGLLQANKLSILLAIEIFYCFFSSPLGSSNRFWFRWTIAFPQKKVRLLKDYIIIYPILLVFYPSIFFLFFIFLGIFLIKITSTTSLPCLTVLLPCLIQANKIAQTWFSWG